MVRRDPVLGSESDQITATRSDNHCDIHTQKWLRIGRIGRLRFATYFLLIIAPVLMAVDVASIAKETQYSKLVEIYLYLVWPYLVGYVVVFLLPIALMRFHDLNRSGWWVWTLLIPGYNLYILYLLLARSGSCEINQFGPLPKPNSPRTYIIFGMFMALPLFFIYKISRTLVYYGLLVSML
ncbi:DUF805 domain-containing protein [Zooshikella harenae]|uniref:DUF805 domain-containing protein n=1 Tax=Zooshikella harenae TaxID=2827238 RepID=A0ABS5Z5Y8_9GAMM|nr:DUF805 domain-containing protein [Zooshikella harenae]MBU2709461.1 DUF805 domain-containing protein [Zooshikella harenae]